MKLLEKWMRPYLEELRDQPNWKEFLVSQTQKTDKYYIGMSVYEEIPEPIKSEIVGFESDYMEYYLEIQTPRSGVKCKILVRIHYPKFQPLLSTYEKIMEKITAWLQIAIRAKPDICGKELHIHLFMSTHKKEYAADNLSLDRKHVNTAHSTGCVEKASIGIFREEEWFKVFIHETFHSFGMSFNESHEDFLNVEFYQTISSTLPRQDLRLYEVHCELMATIFNCLFKSYWEKTDFAKNVKMEQDFSLYQCHKVLQTSSYINPASLQEFNDIVPREKEQTSVFSYYLAKTILLLSIDDFIGFLSKHKTAFVVYEWKHDAVALYIERIFNGFSKFKREYNHSMPFSGKWQTKYAKTMRMTILGGMRKRNMRRSKKRNKNKY